MPQGDGDIRGEALFTGEPCLWHKKPTVHAPIIRLSGTTDVQIISGGTKITSRSTISFSQEIFEKFIDNLHDDKKALKQCALVCRSWVPRSRYHLFASITVSPPTSTLAKLPFSDLVASSVIPFVHFPYRYASSAYRISNWKSHRRICLIRWFIRIGSGLLLTA